MSSKQPHHKTFETLAGTPESALQQIVLKANQLRQCDKILKEKFPPSFHPHCQIANFEQGNLTLAVRNANWSTKIRYQAPDLIKNLRLHPIFKTLKNIRCIIQPKENTSAPTQRLSLSQKNKKLLQTIAKSMKDEKIKEALEKLSSDS